MMDVADRPPAEALTDVVGSPSSSPLRRRAVVVALVVVALAAGFGVAFLVFRPDTPSAFDGPPSVTRLDLPATRPPGEVTPATAAPAPVVEPASAREALQRFLDAEIAGRFDDSFALLDPETRTSDGPVAAWRNGRANRLLPEQFSVVGETAGADADADATDITIEATRTPAVSPQSGLTPARSEEVWRVVKLDGWRVLEGRPVEVRPELPSDAAAAAAGSAWLERAVSCDVAGAEVLQLSSNLLGSPSLLDAPCENKGAWTAGTAVPLSEISNPTVFVSAYGPGVGRWARAVPVTGPGRFTIVLVPLGSEWRVTGVVPEGSPRP